MAQKHPPQEKLFHDKMSLAREGQSIFVSALSIGDDDDMQIYSVRVVHYLTGDELCTLEDCGGDQRVAELKLLIEERIGWLSELTVLIHTGRGELAGDEMLAGIAVEQTIQLYAQLLRKVVVAEKLGMSGRQKQITDDLLNGLCDSLEAEPVDILDLRGCTQIGRSPSPSHLPQLSMVSVLYMAGCKGIPGSLLLACLQGMEGLKVNAGFASSLSNAFCFLFVCLLITVLRRAILSAWRR